MKETAGKTVNITVLHSVRFLPFLFLVTSAWAQAPSQPLEPVNLQLRWHHQFQFAGYYAAKEKGYYREAGLDVTILAGSPERQPVTEVLAGRAEYGEGNSEVVLGRLKGKPLIALAAIFQHSPSALITLTSSGLSTPADLIGKRVMSIGGENDINFRAMFLSQSIPVDSVTWLPSSYQLQDLIDGNTDAFNGYVTNEPYYLEERGIDYTVIHPKHYNIDFYSDILFTSEQELAAHPQRVKRFKEASLKGWKYALANHEEIIQLIREKYNTEKTLNHMRYEALSVHGLIVPDFIEVGYISQARIDAMADVFLHQNMVDSSDRLEGFIFDSEEGDSAQLYWWLKVVGGVLVFALFVVLGLGLFSRRLQLEVEVRKEAEEKLKLLADTDSMTGLLNRRAFTRRYKDELVRAQRYADIFSILLLDLDKFKAINDRYGHDAGDRVICAVADMLRADTRESDRCGRFGGEEFIILMPKTTLEEAAVYAYRLGRDIRNMAIELRDGEVLHVSASIGVAQWQPDDKEEATIIKADKALYKAKASGRDQVEIWNKEMK